MRKFLPLADPISLEEALERARKSGHTHDYLREHYEEEVRKIEAELGPQVPPLVRPRGRPRNGESVEPAEVHPIRVRPSVWQAFAERARQEGLTPNAAAQMALAAWTTRR